VATSNRSTLFFSVTEQNWFYASNFYVGVSCFWPVSHKCFCSYLFSSVLFWGLCRGIDQRFFVFDPAALHFLYSSRVSFGVASDFSHISQVLMPYFLFFQSAGERFSLYITVCPARFSINEVYTKTSKMFLFFYTTKVKFFNIIFSR
jgi:hypothetical protein